jgi:hypothetical protein
MVETDKPIESILAIPSLNRCGEQLTVEQLDAADQTCRSRIATAIAVGKSLETTPRDP